MKVGLSLALVLLLYGSACRGGDAQTPAPSHGPTNASCALAPSSGLRAMTLSAPGPGGKNTLRTYQLYVPAGLASSRKAPLLVSLHGTGANGAIQSALTQWTAFSDSLAPTGGSFIAVFPDGIGSLWYWGAERSYDVTFVFDVIAEVRSSGCVDGSQIYVDGWSEGAFMAQRLACAYGDPAVPAQDIAIAAVHSYAGGNPGDASCGPGGHPKTASRVLLSQGLDDRLIDPQKHGYPAFTAWGRRYSCAAPSQPLTGPQQMSSCRAGSGVAWWPIAGQGHLVWSCSEDPMWHDRGVWAFFTRNVAPMDTTCP